MKSKSLKLPDFTQTNQTGPRKWKKKTDHPRNDQLARDKSYAPKKLLLLLKTQENLMYTHRITVNIPASGRVVVFYEYDRRRLPNTGKDKAYSPSIRQVVDFDFSEILESEVVSHELV